MRCLATLTIIVLASCIGRDAPVPPPGDSVQLGTVRFDVPSGWTRSDSRQPGVVSAVWKPERDNERKESITVIQGATRGKVDDPTLEKLLTGSQAAFAAVKVSRVTPISTGLGLGGFSITTEFTPRRAGERYHRVHVILRDGERLVNVIYTARVLDPQRRALETVLQTIHRQEAAS